MWVLSQGSEGFFIDSGGVRVIWSVSGCEIVTSGNQLAVFGACMGLRKTHCPITLTLDSCIYRCTRSGETIRVSRGRTVCGEQKYLLIIGHSRYQSVSPGF